MMQHTHAYQDFNRFIGTPYWMEFTLFFSLLRMCWYKFSYQSVVFALFFLYAELFCIKYAKTIFEYIMNKFPMPQLAPFSSWGWRGIYTPMTTSSRTGPRSYKNSQRTVLSWLWGRLPSSTVNDSDFEDEADNEDSEGTSDHSHNEDSSSEEAEENLKED